MSQNFLLADSIARINNALMVSHSKVSLDYSKFTESCIKVLQSEGYIKGYSVSGSIKRKIDVNLSYHVGDPVIKVLKIVSKPSRRVYKKISDVTPFYNGLGIHVISTSKGVMSDSAARKNKLGGEVLLSVY